MGYYLTVPLVYFLSLASLTTEKIFSIFLLAFAPLGIMAAVAFGKLNQLFASRQVLLVLFKWLLFNIVYDALYITSYIIPLAIIYHDQCAIPDFLGLELFFIFPALLILNVINLVLMFWGRHKLQKGAQLYNLNLRWWFLGILLAGTLSFIVLYVERVFIF